MTIVHYYLGRPAHVWIAANSRRSPARQAHKGSGRVHSGIPGNLDEASHHRSGHSARRPARRTLR
jgi:hypothetical protein